MFIRERKELIIIKEEDLSASFLSSFENFHNNFPNVICYVEDGAGRMEGIFSWREYKKSSYLGKVEINKKFTAIPWSGDAHIEEFHKRHPDFLNVPCVRDGQVWREYCFAKDKWVSEGFEWERIEDGVLIEAVARRVGDGGKAWVDDGGIRQRIEGHVPMSGDMVQANLQILGMPQYYEHVRESYGHGVFDVGRALSEYNLYIECIIIQMMRAFRRHSVRVRYFGAPNASKISDLDERDRELLLHPQSVNEICGSGEIDEIYRNYEDSYRYMRAREYENIGFRCVDGHYVPIDHRSGTCNIINGVRVTDSVPRNAGHSIYVYGICVARGAFCADHDTVESFLQRRVNQENDDWAVVNCGVAEGLIGAALNDFQYVLHSVYKADDVVIFLSEYDSYTVGLLMENGVGIYETSGLFKKRDGLARWFLDIMPHTTPMANEMMAGYIYEAIRDDLRRNTGDGGMVEVSLRKTRNGAPPDGIGDYVAAIRGELGKRGVDHTRHIGAIVMNCNPFTYGHLYLIEQAKERCDVLLIFVVSEDRSVFRYEDRLAMVRGAIRTVRGGY